MSPVVSTPVLTTLQKICCRNSDMRFLIRGHIYFTYLGNILSCGFIYLLDLHANADLLFLLFYSFYFFIFLLLFRNRAS